MVALGDVEDWQRDRYWRSRQSSKGQSGDSRGPADQRTNRWRYDYGTRGRAELAGMGNLRLLVEFQELLAGR